MSTVTNTNAANNPANTGITSSADAQKRLTTNYQDFLKLLTTQLTNQDPTQPADTNQLTQQIAALSQVEQQINTNSLLERLVTMLSTGQASDAVSYIGRQVDAQGNQSQLLRGKATFVYDLPSTASEATITITNAAGQVVFTGPGTKVAGRNQVVWHGTNGVTGGVMPDGAYKFTVKAKGTDGKDMTATTYSSGVVLAVEHDGGAARLSLGDVKVPIGDVKVVYNPPASTGA